MSKALLTQSLTLADYNALKDTIPADMFTIISDSTDTPAAIGQTLLISQSGDSGAPVDGTYLTNTDMTETLENSVNVSNYTGNLDVLVSGTLELEGTTAFNIKGGVLTVSNTSSFINSSTVNLANIGDGTGTALVWQAGAIVKDTSSERFKKDIVTNDLVNSENIFNLRAVNYKYKASDTKGFGLIAEEVYEQVPEVVNLDEEGKPYSINYALLTLFLIKELKKVKAELAQLTNS